MEFRQLMFQPVRPVDVQERLPWVRTYDLDLKRYAAHHCCGSPWDHRGRRLIKLENEA